MSERVTDEWLREVFSESRGIGLGGGIRLRIAQAVARECVKLLNDLQDENAETDYYTPTDCADRIRARFGLEE